MTGNYGQLISDSLLQVSIIVSVAYSNGGPLKLEYLLRAVISDALRIEKFLFESTKWEELILRAR